MTMVGPESNRNQAGSKVDLGKGNKWRTGLEVGGRGPELTGVDQSRPELGANPDTGLALSLAKVQSVASKAWEGSTRTTYGAGLACWAEWCDDNGIPEQDRMPIEKVHLTCFIADAAGTIGVSGFKNWLNGLWAWHHFHQMPWCGDDPYIHLLLEGAKKMAPKASFHEPRPPVTLSHLYAIYEQMNFQDTYDAACWAVLCAAFWGLARLGKLTVPSRAGFIQGRHVARGTVINWEDVLGVQSVTLRLPWTKTACNGANLILTREEDCSCPYRAIQQHFLTNSSLPDQAHFFAFRTAAGWEPMVKRDLMDRCQQIWSAAGIRDLPSGHSFRIGGTTHLLSRGTHPQVVQKLGRWSSDVFFLYWRNTQLIIPRHVHDAGVRAHMDAEMNSYFGEVSPEVLQRWKVIQSERQKLKQGNGPSQVR
ncbi:hypothetical protein BS47DRAFT_1384564 [Hydnum rufescens UP504]|uniref:Tyr recombinase domain-containing protein n=1 Tax=Hydnum rufescens UP504 TaxID=1448309 RepID=A0A9P6ANI2_9AGAM|nr:hypothetical protein BS47DRAFT_1384564 [Hydnum rufescens UP504]